METPRDLLVLLNRIKEDELGAKAHPFTQEQLSYFSNLSRKERHYAIFTIPKKSGGERTIHAPVCMLKSMLTSMNRILQALYEAPECVTGFVPGRGIADNAERHAGKRFVLCADLEEFFPSISHGRIERALSRPPFGFNGKLAAAVAGLCCIVDVHVTEEGDILSRCHLPQGSPCSPVLANAVCAGLDRKLDGLARRFGLTYSRYADDIAFSGDSFVFGAGGEFMREFRRIVAEEGFALNAGKTRLRTSGERQEVTGLVVNAHANVPREYVRDLDNLLYIWERHGRDAAFAKFLARYAPKHGRALAMPDMERVIRGRIAYVRIIKGKDSPVWQRLLERLDRLTGDAPSLGRGAIIYLNSYTISHFEKAVGTTVELWGSISGFPSGGLATFHPSLPPSFALNGHEQGVTTSKYVATRLRHIRENGAKEEDVSRFKEKFRISYCTRDVSADLPGTSEPAVGRNCFWMITRPRRKREDKPLTDADRERITDSILAIVGVSTRR